jgi:hypothetical protein
MRCNLDFGAARAGERSEHQLLGDGNEPFPAPRSRMTHRPATPRHAIIDPLAALVASSDSNRWFRGSVIGKDASLGPEMQLDS